jgi:hypothetical protein
VTEILPQNGLTLRVFLSQDLLSTDVAMKRPVATAVFIGICAAVFLNTKKWLDLSVQHAKAVYTHAVGFLRTVRDGVVLCIVFEFV